MGTMVGKSDKRTFALILLAQFCSLLGQEVLQFVLPLYLLDATGSGAMFGLAIAYGFVPYTLLSPIGGVMADRTRKVGIMVGVNAALVAVLLLFLQFKDFGDPFASVVFATMASFVAQALYQPAIQSTVPFVLASADVPRGVALVSQVGSLTTLGGPVIGAALYGAAGLSSVVWMSLAAFALSAVVVAVLVRVPCELEPWEGGALAMVRADLASASCYLKGMPVLLGGMLAATFVNISASALVNVGTVYIATKTLGLPALCASFALKGMPVLLGGMLAATFVNISASALVNVGTVYIATKTLGLPALCASFAQLTLGAGSLVGHSLLAVAPGRFSLRRSPVYIGGIALAMAGIAWALAPVSTLEVGGKFACMVVAYAFATAAGGLTGSCMLAELQTGAPVALVGKLIALFMTLVNCATPIGQAGYGVLFDAVPAWAIFALTAVKLAIVTVAWRRFLRRHAS